ncbi:MFS transporter [Paenibacillus planticolens]|uniref:MFS transporter n=1 Tax=Paenibacillus planticolens TaxID=2654976 RepID=A0ABX1ZNP5_9BACL|nr:MFS transporter [Paenibacillus planticolens]NOV01719.1 MFS transporter [Paenibacillus planticolens]
MAVQSEKQLSLQAKSTLLNHGIYQFGNALAGVFISLYLWKLTNDLWINGAFQLIMLLSAPIATIYIGKIAKIRDRLYAYRAGIYLTALLYVLILIAQERMVDYYIWFAVLKGVSTAFYWLGNFTMISDVTDNQNRHNYLGWNAMVTHVANLSGPALAGLIIASFSALNGYMIVFGLSSFMFVLASLLSLHIKKKPTHHTAYYLKYTGLMLKKRPDFTKSLLGWFIIGLPQGIMMYVPAILLFQVLPQESWVGYLNAFFLSLSILSSYVLSKTGSESSTRSYLSISAWGFVVSSFFLLWDISLWTVIVFMCVSSLFKPLQANSYTAHYYQLIGELPLKENFRIESIVIRESVINMGRAAGVLLFMGMASGADHVWLPWILVFVMLMQVSIRPLIHKSI